jgi:hypothetical protein
MHETYYKKAIHIKPKEMCILRALMTNQSFLIQISMKALQFCLADK